VSLVAHPASVTADLRHSLDALAACGDITLTSAFGPQHGLKGDKQDNMVETLDEVDPALGIPVFSLYGEVRRPTPAMMDTADVFLFDLQDLGCRIYTFVTTLLYLLEAASQTGKSVWVLDRPNPAGRPVEGTKLIPGQESFVGAGPMPMRHGLTLGEMGHWFIRYYELDVDYRVIGMQGWQPEGPGWLAREPDLDQPQPECRKRQHGPRLCRHGDDRGRDAVGSTRHDAASGSAVRRAGCRCQGRAGRDAGLRAGVAGGLRDPRVLVYAHLPQACGELCSALMVHAEGSFYDHHAFRPGACRRWLSRQSADSTRITRSGATSPTSMSSPASPSM
jgi:hypothetical protein